MNDIPTARIAYDGVRQVTYGADYSVHEGPSLPWPMLKASLPRQPTVFIVLPPGSAGDSGPFMSLLADLVDCLPGRYHLLRLTAGNTCWDTNTLSTQSLSDRITETQDALQWLHQMRTTPPDAVLTNQLFFRDRDGPIADGRHWERLLHDELFWLPENKQISVLLIEFVQQGTNAWIEPGGWKEKVESGTISVEVYKAWQAHHGVDHAFAAQNRKDFGQRQLPSLLMLECYPAEFMTKDEMALVTGIMCGPVEPRVGSQSNFEALNSFISDSRAAGRKIVLLARGGIVANDTEAVTNLAPAPNRELPLEDQSTIAELLSIVDYGLAMRLADQVAIIAQGAAASECKRVTNHIFSVSRMELDFSQILPRVDLVIHHGGSGTTFAVLKAGIPQIVVPGVNDTSDQLHHGGRVDSLGCGRLLRPRLRFDESVGADAISDVVQAVEDMLQDQGSLKEVCSRWQRTFTQCDGAEGVPVAVDTLRRIIAKILLGKSSVGCESATGAEVVGTARL